MKQKTGRKLLSFLLTLAMVVGLMPGLSLTAYADGTHTHDGITFVEWTDALDGWVVADSVATVRVSSTDRHYGPTWKEQSLTVSAPQALSVELVELPPQNTIIIIR